jgi:hypothetical protein
VLLALLALLLGVSGGGYWLASTRGTPVERWADDRRLLPDLEPAAVTALSLERPPAAPVEVSRDELGRWEIVAPRQLPADQMAVEELLRRLQRARVLASTPVEPDTDLSPWGLRSPVQTMRLRTGDGRQIELSVGGEAVGLGHFVRRRRGGAGGDVVTVPETLLDGVARSLADLRSRHIFQVEVDAVESLQILTPEHTLALVRGEGGWILEEPLRGPADRQLAEQLVTELVNLEVDRYLREDPGPETTALDRPVFRLRVQGGEWLDIGDHAGPATRYARRGEDVFLVPEGLTRELLRDPGRLRDRDLLDVPLDRVEEVSIRGEEIGTVLLRRLDGDAWELQPAAGAAQPAEAPVVRDFLRLLDRSRIEEFPREAVAGEGLTETSFAVEVCVRLVGGGEVGYRARRPRAGDALVDLALLGQPRMIYRVRRELAELPLEGGLTFRSRQVHQLPAGLDPTAAAAGTLRLRRHTAAGEERWELERRAGEPWHRVEGGSAPVDSPAVSAMVQELCQLRCAGYVSPPMPALTAGPEPQIEVRLELEWEEHPVEVWRLVVHGEALAQPGQYLASSPAVPGLVLRLAPGTARRFLVSLE